ncbi:hypothetical protein A8990_13957 [Paenibacillus taihuensis]|uniref:Uncharacterized protein n=1 Tax=Paenibacillus taihuensis TaxID=1156355 RepID=A0A3D9R1E7_9BACL|nr:hypothetical protein A8990_13957 [Paenibacillus taihuensis]
MKVMKVAEVVEAEAVTEDPDMASIIIMVRKHSAADGHSSFCSGSK